VAFTPGYDANLTVGGTNISAFTKGVKFQPARKDYELPVLGGNAVKRMVGPVATMIDIDGFLDPTVVSLFNGFMAQTTPTSTTFSYQPQGAGGSTQSGNAFVVDFQVDTTSEGPATFTAKLAVDGAVTFG
jgi:hypothetical protein